MFDKLPISSKTEKILTKSLDEAISVEEANHLMNIKGSDLYPLIATADYLRSEIVGNDVTFINNCNINFTNICTVRCGFCAFGKDADDPRGSPRKAFFIAASTSDGSDELVSRMSPASFSTMFIL